MGLRNLSLLNSVHIDEKLSPEVSGMLNRLGPDIICHLTSYPASLYYFPKPILLISMSTPSLHLILKSTLHKGINVNLYRYKYTRLGSLEYPLISRKLLITSVVNL